jgi:hypothetical protein
MQSVVTPEDLARHNEKRRSSRQTFMCKGLLYRDNRAAGPQRVNLKDVSMLGVGFESARPVEPGTRCRLQIELGPTKISWRIRVVCCGKIEDDLYRLGCEFIPAELPLFDLGENELEAGHTEHLLALR